MILCARPHDNFRLIVLVLSHTVIPFFVTKMKEMFVVSLLLSLSLFLSGCVT